MPGPSPRGIFCIGCPSFHAESSAWHGLWEGPAGPDSCSSHPQGAYCGQCSERIWGLSRQGYRCINCKLLVHKRCHVLVPLTCRRHMVSRGCGGGWLASGPLAKLILAVLGPCHSIGVVILCLPPDRRRPVCCRGGDYGQSLEQDLSS